MELDIKHEGVGVDCMGLEFKNHIIATFVRLPKHSPTLAESGSGGSGGSGNNILPHNRIQCVHYPEPSLPVTAIGGGDRQERAAARVSGTPLIK